MRIVGGSVKGHTLKAPKGNDTRPTTDRVREAMMSILDSRDYLEDARVLDLFSGSGALALEALSRGAQSAICVEHASAAQRVISENIKSLGFSSVCRLLKMPVRRALVMLAKAGEKVDLVFADPPYAYDPFEELAGIEDILSDNSIILLEHSKKLELPDTLARLDKSLTRVYGDSAISLYERI